MGEVYRVGTEFYPYHMARRVWERNILPYAKQDSIVIVESFREKVNYDYFKMLMNVNKNNINNILTIKVIRPNFNDIQDKDMENHISEIDLEEFNFDWTIVNNGSVEDLKKSLRNTVDKGLWRYVDG